MNRESETGRRKRMPFAILAVLGGLLGRGVPAQPPPGSVESQLLQRQQYQDELLLRQRQFQRQTDPTLTPGQRLELERRHFEQTQRQRELHDSQLRRHGVLQQALPQLPPARQQEQLLYEQGRFVSERQNESQPLEYDP